MLFSIAFETDRLVARAPVENDIPSLVKHLSNPSISQTTLTIPFPYSESDARHWINKAIQDSISELAYTFVLESKLNSEIIGAAGLHLAPSHDRSEAGYWIAEEYWNMGYATEALTGLIRFGFDKLNLNKIYATHMDLNPSSGKVMLKAGMKHEGNLKSHYKKGDKYVDVVQYAVLKTEFINPMM